MLKKKSKILLLLIATILVISTISFATDNTLKPTDPGANARTEVADDVEGGIVTTSQEPETPDIYNGDLYLFNNNVVMDKLVDGNVFIVGNNVEITGRVNGCLFVLGNKVTFGNDTYIVQSIYVCANELVLNGSANDLYAACNTIDMSYDSFMVRDLRVAADNFNFNGGVGRNAFARVNNFNFATSGDNTAIVYGNLDYSSSNQLELNKELVQGEVTYSAYSDTDDENSIQEIIMDMLINLLETISFTLVVFFLIVWFAPKFKEKLVEFIGTKSVLAFGVGALSCVVAVLISLLLLITSIGVPLAIATFTLFMLILSISFTVTTTCITFKLKEKFKLEKKYFTTLTLIATTIVLWALKQIPIIGWIVSLMITLLGFGIVVLYLFNKIKVKEQK